MRQRKNETKEEYLERCRIKQREYYKRNIEKEHNRQKEYYAKNKEKERERHLRTYNRGDGKHFCCEDLSLIENYELAKADNFKGWDLHHRLEIGSFYTLSVEELKSLDLYFDRPADELIYLRHNEHAALHNKYRK
jgi:hypothetical protein